MVLNLLIGLPTDRPGGLLLTLLYFVAAGFGAVALGLAYGVLCTIARRASLPLQALSALLRGVPLLLMVFFLAQATILGAPLVGLASLVLYSYAHIGEILRSYLAAYPIALANQARASGISPFHEWVQLRVPWAFGASIDAIGTHWVSLLKDTGALVILGVGELTTVTKILAESSASYERWLLVLLSAAALYLAATLVLIHGIRTIRRRPSLQGATG